MSRKVYDLGEVFPVSALTEEMWPKFLCALIHPMSEKPVNDMWDYATTPFLKKAYWAARVSGQKRIEQDHAKWR
eukprot:10960308-Karenia_brevis.AAC.1